MSHHHRLLTAAALVALLAGCQSAEPLVRVETVTLTQREYVPVPRELTEPCPIATGGRAEVFDVARQRREALERCNADKAAIRALGEKAAEQTRGE